MRLKYLIGVAVVAAALGMPAATAYATDGPATAGQSETASTTISGTSTETVSHVAIRPDAVTGTGGGGIIVCAFSATGAFTGGNSNVATAAVKCPVTVDDISMQFFWFRNSTGALLRSAPKPPCLAKAKCSKSDGFKSLDVLDVEACAEVAKAGYVFTSACIISGPF